MRYINTVLLLLLCIFVAAGAWAQVNTLKVGPDETYNTIQSAIDAANPGDVIEVAAGTYEEQLDIDKSLTLLGPNYDKAGNAPDRVAESIIQFYAPESLEDGVHVLTNITASGVIIKGFSFNDNVTADFIYAGTWPIPKLVGGITSFESNTEVENNRFSGFNNIAVRMTQTPAHNTQTTVAKEDNITRNNYFDGGSVYHSIYYQASAGVIDGNYIENSGSGIQIQPYFTNASGTVSNNYLSIYGNGLYYNYANWNIDNNAVWNFTDNTVNVAAGDPDWSKLVWDAAPRAFQGIRVETYLQDNPSGALNNEPMVNFANNAIDGNGADSDGAWSAVEGIYFRNVKGNSATNVQNITFSNNTFSNVEVGVQFDDATNVEYDIAELAGNGNTYPAGMVVIPPYQLGFAPVINITQNTGYYTIQAAIDAADPDDVIEMAAGLYELEQGITINKGITLQGKGRDETTIEISSTWFDNPNTKRAFILSSNNITIQGLHFQVVGKGQGSILLINQFDSILITNNKFSGEYIDGEGEVTRATEWAAGITSIEFSNNIVEALRQPGYINGGSGIISDNHVSGTRGWVLADAGALVFDNNTWSNNSTDITILETVSSAFYPVTQKLIDDNNNADVDDRRDIRVINITQNVGYATIQAAIDAADEGDVIEVAAGTYAERLLVNKSLDLRGAQHGVDPTAVGVRTDMNEESTIDLTGLAVQNPNVLIEIPNGVSNVSISGFNLIGSPTLNYADESIIRAWDDNITIADNISDGWVGVLHKGPVNDLRVQRNRITINKTGVVVQSGPSMNVTISGNSFTLGTIPGSDESAIYLTNTSQSEITGNRGMGFTGRFLHGSNVHNIMVSDNIFIANRDGISIFGGSTFITINDNTFTDNTRYGINIKGADLLIQGNEIKGSGTVGIFLDDHVNVTERVEIANNEFLDNKIQVEDKKDRLTLEDILANNTFDRAVVVRGSPIIVPIIFSSIQDAIDATSTQAGYFITVAAGTYTEQIHIEKSLNLSGEEGAVIQAPPANERTTYTIAESPRTFDPIIFVDGGGSTISVTIDGFEIDGRDDPGNNTYTGILMRQTDVGVVSNNNIHSLMANQETVGISVYGEDTKVTVTDNEITGFRRNALAVIDAAEANIIGNTITGMGYTKGWAQNGIQLWGVGSGNVSGNTLSEIGWIWETGTKFSSTGILIWECDGTTIVHDNTLNNVQVAIRAANSSFEATENSISMQNSADLEHSGGIWGNPQGRSEAIASPFRPEVISSTQLNYIDHSSPMGGGPVELSFKYQDNIVIGDDRKNGWGIGIWPKDGFVIDASATGNKVTNWEIGFDVWGNGDFAAVIKMNQIEDNEYDVYNWTNTIVDATENWWGTTDPVDVAGKVFGDVQFVPFLVPDLNGQTYPWSGTDTYSPTGFLPVVVYDGDPDNAGAYVNSYFTIQEAINDATTIGGHYIKVAAGTYNEDLLINKNVNIHGAGADQTLLTNRVRMAGPFVNVSFEDFKIERSTAPLLTAEHGAPSFNGVTFEGVEFLFTGVSTNPSAGGRRAITFGFGIDATIVGNGLTFKDVVFEATHPDEVAPIMILRADGGAHPAGPLTFDGVTVIGSGGYNAINTYGGVNVTVKNSKTENGGAFYLSAITNLTVTNNEFTGAGGVFVNGADGAIITDNEFKDIPADGFPAINFSAAWGPEQNYNVLFENNTFSNVDVTGIRIYNYTSSDPDNNFLTANNNDFSGIDELVISNPFSTHFVDASENWWGTTQYSEIYKKVTSQVVFVPYHLNADGTVSGGGPSVAVDLIVNHTAANQDIFVQFEVKDGDMELYPVPGLDPNDPDYLADVTARYAALGAALESGDADAIRAAALAVGDDVIIEYYYLDDTDKVYLKTINDNDLIKNKYWNKYLVRDDGERFPAWADDPIQTLILQDRTYRTHTNPGTGSVAEGWLDDAIGKDLYVAVTLIQNGSVNQFIEPVTINVVSTYEFVYDIPDLLLKGIDALIPVTFKTDKAGNLGYDATRFSFSATGPAGSEVTFTATDSNNDEYTFTNSGYWGPSAGFDLPAEYDATTEWTLNFSHVGEYTIIFNAFQVGDEANPFASGTEVLNVESVVVVSTEPDEERVYPGQEILLPISVSSVDGFNITAYELTLEFDHELIIPLEVIKENTLSEDGNVTVNLQNDGKVIVAYAHSNPLADEGTLLFVKFLVDPELTAFGTTLLELPKMELQSIDGNPNIFTIIGRLIVGPLYGDVNLDQLITAVDPQLVLQYAVELIDLNYAQFINADVDGNNKVQALDASLILQYIVGMINIFPVEVNSGSGQGGGSQIASGGFVPSPSGNVVFDGIGRSEEFITIPLTIQETGSVYALELMAEFDPEVLTIEDIHTNLPDGWLMAENIGDGILRIAMAGTRELRDGVFATLLVNMKDNTVETEITAEYILNADGPRVIEYSLRDIPDEFKLAQNYPNPFNPVTTIQYQLPEDARVQLVIYNRLGQVVKTLVNEEQIAGYYRIQWDGTNNAGVSVASGLYIYRLQSKDFIDVKRMIFLK